MNFVISKNVKTTIEKSEIRNTNNNRKNNMTELNIYKAIEFRNQEVDKRNQVDKYLCTRNIC